MGIRFPLAPLTEGVRGSFSTACSTACPSSISRLNLPVVAANFASFSSIQVPFQPLRVWLPHLGHRPRRGSEPAGQGGDPPVESEEEGGAATIEEGSRSPARSHSLRPALSPGLLTFHIPNLLDNSQSRRSVEFTTRKWTECTVTLASRLKIILKIKFDRIPQLA
jgi:hypothetical protein